MDMGFLIKKCMEIIDDEMLKCVMDFIWEQYKVGKFWFVWWNGMCMYFCIYVKEVYCGLLGQDEYLDGMVEYDLYIG